MSEENKIVVEKQQEFTDYVGIIADAFKPELATCTLYPDLVMMHGYIDGFVIHMSEPDKPEKIVAAAMQALKNRRLYLYVGYPKARHHHLIELMIEMLGHDYRPPSAEHKGFLTSHGRYVSRVQARLIAQTQGQLLKTAYNTPHLFSEDIW